METFISDFCKLGNYLTSNDWLYHLDLFTTLALIDMTQKLLTANIISKTSRNKKQDPLHGDDRASLM